MSHSKFPDIPEERPSEEFPKKIPRILPVSREEYDSHRRYAGERTEYFPSTFNVNLEDDDEEEEETTEEQKSVFVEEKRPQEEAKTSWIHILTMLPAFLTGISVFWHIVFQETAPFWHSIIDFVLILYATIWGIFIVKEDNNSVSDVMLLLSAVIFDIAMLGIYADKQSMLLQLLFTIPFASILLLISTIIAYQEGKKGFLHGFLLICVWFLTVTGMLALKVKYFRWMGFIHLVNIIISVLLVGWENGTKKKQYLLLALFAVIEAVAVVIGFGA